MSTRGNICIKVAPENYDEMTTLCESIVDEVHPYVFIYNHFDSYPTGLGKTLLNDYNSYDKALALIAQGDCSCPGNPYATREPFHDNIPRVTSNKFKALQEEYLYVYENSAWECYDYKQNKISLDDLR